MQPDGYKMQPFVDCVDVNLSTVLTFFVDVAVNKRCTVDPRVNGCHACRGRGGKRFGSPFIIPLPTVSRIFPPSRWRVSHNGAPKSKTMVCSLNVLPRQFLPKLLGNFRICGKTPPNLLFLDRTSVSPHILDCEPTRHIANCEAKCFVRCCQASDISSSHDKRIPIENTTTGNEDPPLGLPRSTLLLSSLLDPIRLKHKRKKKKHFAYSYLVSSSRQHVPTQVL